MSIFGNLRKGVALRDLLLFLAKLIVSALLIGYIVSRLSLTEVKDVMTHPHWGWLGLALACYGLSAFGGALQWTWILRATGIKAPAREIRRLYFIGLFFNNFLPANVGGDAWKIVDLGRQEGRPAGVLCATILDRLIGMGALTLMALILLTLCTVLGIPLPMIVLSLFLVLLMLFVLLLMLMSKRLGGLAANLFERFGLPGVGRQVTVLTKEFQLYRTRVRWLNGVFLFSMLVQFLRISTHLLVALGLGFTLELEQAIQLFVLIPMVAIILTLPITINGIGLRESVSASLLVSAGIAEPHAVAMGSAAFLVQVIFSLQGGILLWMGRWRQSDNEVKNEVKT